MRFCNWLFIRILFNVLCVFAHVSLVNNATCSVNGVQFGIAAGNKCYFLSISLFCIFAQKIFDNLNFTDYLNKLICEK